MDIYLLITSVLFFILECLYIVLFINIFHKDHNIILAQFHKHDAMSFILSAGLSIMGFKVTMNFIRLVAQLSQLIKQRLELIPGDQRLELIPGDHIYTWSAFCKYSNHEFFFARNKVIHLTRGKSCVMFREGNDGGIYICGSKFIFFTKESFDRPKRCAKFGEGNNGVICTCLDCFLRGGCLLRYEYGVPKLSLLFQTRGSRSCTIVSSDRESKAFKLKSYRFGVPKLSSLFQTRGSRSCTIVSSDRKSKAFNRAQYTLKSYRFGDTALFEVNSEDFALYCKSERISLCMYEHIFAVSEEIAASRSSTGLQVAPRRWTLLQPQKHDALSFITSAVLIIMDFIMIKHFIRWVPHLSQLLKRPLKLIPGDHIYTWRASCTYSHHGIYIGDNKVIHFTKESSDRRKRCESCAKFGEGNNGVICTCLDCFLRGGFLRRYEYGVSKLSLLFQIRGRGSCTVASSDTGNKVIDRADSLFRTGFGDYNLFRQNCEDFALYCKTGFIIPVVTRGASGQIAALWSAGMLLFVERYRADIGVRRDKMKVPVGEISKFPCTFHSSYVFIAASRKVFFLGFECYWYCHFLVMMHSAGTGTNSRTEVLELLVYLLAFFVWHFVVWSLYMEAKERTILGVTRSSMDHVHGTNGTNSL